MSRRSSTFSDSELDNKGSDDPSSLPQPDPRVPTLPEEENDDDGTEFDEEDARRMSPRRNSEELERIGTEARAVLEEQAKSLQSGLLALIDRVDKVKEEHDKLEGENRFLQEYIGSLMATSKITASGSGSSGTGGSRNSGRVK